METTVSHDISEAEIRDTFGPVPLVPGDTFLKSKITILSLSDQYLFQRFGQGPITRVPYRCIHHAFEANAAVNPNSIAVSYLTEEITYGELNNQANLLALELIKSGVQKGDNVGLFIQRSIPMIVGILAILKAGAAYVPQHIGLAKESQLRYVVKSASINIILTLSEHKDSVPVIESTKHICIDDFLKSSYRKPEEEIKQPNVAVTENDVCYIIFTSGTTGDPNGVQVTHGNTCNILLTSPGNLGMRPGLKVGQILSIAFDMSVWEILGSLANGATLVIRGKNIQETVSKVDVVISTPTILSSLDVELCKNVKVAIVAGEPCPRVLAEKWSSFCAFHNSCGPTEITIINTVKRFFPTDELLTIGKPTPNNTVYILNEDLTPCAIGEVGEMWAGGLCVTKGYINNQVLTNERYLEDPFLGEGKKMFRTRDLGRWTLDGELEHLGRTDDQVKICGFRVELDSVSSIIEKMPESKRAITLKKDNRTLISFVSPETVNSEKVKEAVAEVLPYYCVPAIVITMKELPMTNRGKIDKRKLLDSISQYQTSMDTETIIKDQETKKNSQVFDLDKIQLPPQKKTFSRIWKGEKLMHYYRLFALLLAANIGVLIYGITEAGWWSVENIRLDIISKIALINFTIGILIRQQYIINFLFWIATSIPTSWPLSIRRRAGKVYHFGGIHIGGTISGTLWFTVFMGSLYYDFFNSFNQQPKSITLLWITSVLTGILIYMIIMALPGMRAKFHDNFERTHRFGGWTALLLFWVQILLIIKQQNSEINFSEALYNSFSFWMLVLITVSIALPWLRLKKVKVDITKPSNHVILARFNYGETPFAGSSTAISRDPLMEWHSFANVPEPGKEGFRLTISRAGDWTGDLIDDMPKYLWVKGITTAGVGNVDKLFKKVIWVATGSGIGPCLPHLFSHETPARLIWATRNPRKTYGDDLVDEILESQPEALIWDTDEHGKPDMVKLAYKAYKEFNAEAVICISNKKLTWQVVYGMESRGIPAYGAIWDS